MFQSASQVNNKAARRKLRSIIFTTVFIKLDELPKPSVETEHLEIQVKIADFGEIDSGSELERSNRLDSMTAKRQLPI